MSQANIKPRKPIIRCAIYTRKSSEEGLDMEFNSLDAQREAAEAFIASQKAEGWTALPDRYDDGGYSGGSMERPALDRLIRDIDKGKIDCVVVYKVDRLTQPKLNPQPLLTRSPQASTWRPSQKAWSSPPRTPAAVTSN